MAKPDWNNGDWINGVQSFSFRDSDILAKFKAYFALGVKSCWLVIPPVKTISVYSQLGHFKTFAMDMGEVIDEVIDIHLPLHKIFRR